MSSVPDWAASALLPRLAGPPPSPSDVRFELEASSVPAPSVPSLISSIGPRGSRRQGRRRSFFLCYSFLFSPYPDDAVCSPLLLLLPSPSLPPRPPFPSPSDLVFPASALVPSALPLQLLPLCRYQPAALLQLFDQLLRLGLLLLKGPGGSLGTLRQTGRQRASESIDTTPTCKAVPEQRPLFVAPEGLSSWMGRADSTTPSSIHQLLSVLLRTLTLPASFTPSSCGSIVPFRSSDRH